MRSARPARLLGLLFVRLVAEFQRELNRLAARQDAQKARHEAELTRIKRNLRQLIEAIKAGVPGASVKDEIGELEQKRSEIEAKLQAAPAPAPRLQGLQGWCFESLPHARPRSTMPSNFQSRFGCADEFERNAPQRVVPGQSAAIARLDYGP